MTSQSSWLGAAFNAGLSLSHNESGIMIFVLEPEDIKHTHGSRPFMFTMFSGVVNCCEAGRFIVDIDQQILARCSVWSVDSLQLGSSTIPQDVESGVQRCHTCPVLGSDPPKILNKTTKNIFEYTGIGIFYLYYIL